MKYTEHEMQIVAAEHLLKLVKEGKDWGLIANHALSLHESAYKLFEGERSPSDLNAVEAEQVRWQEAIRDEVQKHNPSAEIDGGGCDGGDPLDVSLDEIAQGFGDYENRANDALEDLGLRQAAEKGETSLDAVIRLFTSDSWEPDVEAMAATIVELRAEVNKLRCVPGSK